MGNQRGHAKSSKSDLGKFARRQDSRNLSFQDDQISSSVFDVVKERNRVESCCGVGKMSNINTFNFNFVELSRSRSKGNRERLCGWTLREEPTRRSQTGEAYKLEVWTDSSSARAISQGRRTKRLEVQTVCVCVPQTSKQGTIPTQMITDFPICGFCFLNF